MVINVNAILWDFIAILDKGKSIALKKEEQM